MGIFGGKIRRMFGRAGTVACIFSRDKLKDAVNQNIILFFVRLSSREKIKISERLARTDCIF